MTDTGAGKRETLSSDPRAQARRSAGWRSSWPPPGSWPGADSTACGSTTSAPRSASRSGMYGYFSSKEDVLAECYRHHAAPRRGPGGGRRGEPAEILDALLAVHVVRDTEPDLISVQFRDLGSRAAGPATRCAGCSAEYAGWGRRWCGCDQDRDHRRAGARHAVFACSIPVDCLRWPGGLRRVLTAMASAALRA